MSLHHHGKWSFSVFTTSHSPVTFEAKPQQRQHTGTFGAWSKVTQIIKHKKCWIQEQASFSKEKIEVFLILSLSGRKLRRMLPPPSSRRHASRDGKVLIRFLNGSQWTRSFAPRSNNRDFSTREHFRKRQHTIFSYLAGSNRFHTVKLFRSLRHTPSQSFRTAPKKKRSILKVKCFVPDEFWRNLLDTYRFKALF